MPGRPTSVGAVCWRALCVLLALSVGALGCWPAATRQTVEPQASAPPPAAGITASPVPALSTHTPLPPTAQPAETETPPTRPEPPTAEASPTSEVTPVEGPAFALSANPEDDLLFRVTTADGRRIYYCGFEADGAMELTHVVLDDGTGDLATILYDGRLLPVQWILPGLTTAVYPPPEGYEAQDDLGSWFDPHAAFHVVLDRGEEGTLTADIWPGDLAALVAEMEAATDRSFDGARTFLGSHDVDGWSELVALARTGGPDQPLYIAAAVGFSSAAAALGLERAATTSTAARLAGMAAPARTIWRPVIQIGAGVLGGVLAGEIGEALDPEGGPSVEVLLCRGAAKYGLCHYLFFYRDQVGACVSFCRTSLRCFTDICMPMTISADLAMRMRNALARR